MKKVLLMSALLAGCGLNQEYTASESYLTVKVSFYTNFGEKITETYTDIVSIKTDTSARVIYLVDKNGTKRSVSYLGGEFSVE